jgi:hypothetical protein
MYQIFKPLIQYRLSHLTRKLLGHWFYWRLVAWIMQDKIWQDGKTFRQYIRSMTWQKQK